MAALCCYSSNILLPKIPDVVICNNPPPSLSHFTTYCAFTNKTNGGMNTERMMTMRNRSSLNVNCSRLNTTTAKDATSLDINSTDEEEVLLLEYYPICKSTTKSQRRELLLQLAAGLFSLPLVSKTRLALADDDASQEFRLYLDDVNKFKILIPPDWQVGSGEGDGMRSLTAFYPQDSSTTSVSLVISGLGADFTRLESFGKVDAFAETLVGGLDRSWQRPPGVTAKLVDSKSANGLYYIEYTLQNPGESRKHLFSVLGISNNGWYNRLYTLTGQYVDEEAEKFGPTIEKAVVSFRLI